MEPISTVNTNDINAQNAIADLNKLSPKVQTDEEKLWEAAQGFEAIFVTKLMEQMGSSSMNESGFLSGGRGEKMFKSMFYQEIGKEVSKNPEHSFGLAKAIYEQLKPTVCTQNVEKEI